MNPNCPVCETGESLPYTTIDGFAYLRCSSCGSLHIESSVLERMDAGETIRLYDETYWWEELKGARERAAGDGLVRSAEAILYSRRPVRRFLDVGAGPGFLLDSLGKQLPGYAHIFHGVELYPPQERSSHVNYFAGRLADLNSKFDGGVCIEVIEHLTPGMLAALAASLARISNIEALWLFNTGMSDFVMNEDPAYLDPLHRGHIVSYSLAGVTHIFEPHGFTIRALPGKSFAFVAEYQSPPDSPDFEYRMYHPLAENKQLLEQSCLLYLAAFEAARSSFFQAECLARTRWALGLQSELDRARLVCDDLRSQLETSQVGHVTESR